MTEPLVAGIELGGTKCVALLARGRTVVDRLRLPTTEPAATLAALSARVASWHAATPVAAIGIASFGPLALDPAQAAFGHIVSTTKPGWSGTDVRGHFASRFAGPIGFDTDVGGAALAEGRWGAAQDCADYAYLTIGTGVGVGIVANGRLVHGAGHCEAGHIRVRRGAGDGFAGACRFHGDCLEGLVAGPSLAARTGLPGHEIPEAHPVWAHVAAEVAELMAMLILTVSPRRIVVGGGVAGQRPALLPAVYVATSALLGGYFPAYSVADLQEIIVPAALGDDAGPLGAVRLGGVALAADG